MSNKIDIRVKNSEELGKIADQLLIDSKSKSVLVLTMGAEGKVSFAADFSSLEEAETTEVIRALRFVSEKISTNHIACE